MTKNFPTMVKTMCLKLSKKFKRSSKEAKEK